MRKRTIYTMALAMLVLAMAAMPGVSALGDEEGGGVSAAAVIDGDTITYQGYLTDGGEAANGSYDFRFDVFFDAAGGAVLSSVPAENTEVIDGRFVVDLVIDNDAWTGQEIFLEINVRPGDSGGGFQSLLPRQRVSPAAYAVGLVPGARIIDTEDTPGHTLLVGRIPGGFGTEVSAFAAVGDNEHGIWTESESGDGIAALSVTGIAVDARRTGGGTNPAVRGDNESTAGGASGVLGIISSTGPGGNSAGVRGINNGTGQNGIGVYGSHDGSGWGVYGTSVEDYGVYGRSTNGTGVRGLHADPAGTAPGVMGQTSSSSNNAIGVLGEVTSSNPGGFAAGVKGEIDANDSSGIGVWGSHSGGGWGVAGVSASGIGVLGQSSNNSYGVAAVSLNGRILAALDGAFPFADLRFVVENNGDVKADGTYTSPAADFAELLPASTGLVPGDVLAIGPDGTLVASSSAFQKTVAGVYSTKPAFLGGADVEGDDDPNKVPLGIVGVLPVKVTGQNGAIAAGDLLVASDTPGHAMAAGDNPPAGSVIGKALESHDSGTGVITMLVSLH